MPVTLFAREIGLFIVVPNVMTMNAAITCKPGRCKQKDINPKFGIGGFTTKRTKILAWI
jgi:hypothetical protein